MATVWALLVLAGFAFLTAASMGDFALTPRGRKAPEFVVGLYRLAAVLLGLALAARPGARLLYPLAIGALLLGWYPFRDRLRRR
jgi:hypothetical protein